MILIKGDQKCQEATNSKMCNTVSMGKKNAQFSFISYQKVLYRQPKDIRKYRMPIQKPEDICNYPLTTTDATYIRLKETEGNSR